MPAFEVNTGLSRYTATVRRGALEDLAASIPPRAGRLFVVTTHDVWNLHRDTMERALNGRDFDVLFFPGGEERKRLASVEALADQMLERKADRSSIVIAFGGGIVGDLAGFLAAIFMRGVPVIQVPTTLLAQVDAAVGGKTGANLAGGKNLIGAFHQPLAVLIDPDFCRTLPAREYRAGLYEIIKTGIIADATLFDRMAHDAASVLALAPEVVEEIIAASVRVKAEVVSADEREGGLRRILNFGHTLGHALEAETAYSHLLHGEAVAFGMRAVTHLGEILGTASPEVCARIHACVAAYGAIPPLEGINPANLVARTGADKKTIQGKVHFVLPETIGSTVIRSGIDPTDVLEATRRALADLKA